VRSDMQLDTLLKRENINSVNDPIKGDIGKK
jgi:hypothetical protein